MENAKHTPGPWVYGPEVGQDCTRIENEKGTIVAAVVTRKIESWEKSRPIYSWSPEGSANARLIAAAPELLDVATRLVRIAGSQYHGEDAAEEFDALVIQARAAIAKATGEQ